MRELTVTELEEVSGGISLGVNATSAGSLSFSDRTFNWSLGYKGASSGTYSGSGGVFAFNAANVKLAPLCNGHTASVELTI